MQVNKKIASEVMPLSLVAAVAILLLARVGSGIYERMNPEKFKSIDLVEWRQPLVGLKESQETGKPVFMYFSGAGYFHKDEEYRRNYFSDEKIAQEINSKYIPVKVWDAAIGKTPKDPVVQQMQDKFLQWYTQPTVHVVPKECQIIHARRYSLPHFYTFSTIDPRRNMFSFIDSNSNWHPVPVSPAKEVKWAKIEDAQNRAKLEHKPVLYFFARHNDEECNEAMSEFFSKSKTSCKKHNLEQYVCCMIYDHAPSGAKNTQTVDSLIQKYKVQTYPTFIIDKTPIQGITDKVIGYRGHDSMEEFLANNLCK